MKALLIYAILFFAVLNAQAGMCEKLLRGPKEAASHKTSASYNVNAEEPVILTVNMENFFLKRNKNLSPEEQKKRSQVEPEKPEKELDGIAQVIFDSRASIMFFQEVESIEALRRFNRDFLNDQFEVFLVEGNDPRGIDVGFMVHKGLGKKIEAIRSHKDRTWFDPISKSEDKVFSRDLPVLILRNEDGTPYFILVGHHGKSKRNRNGDPNSTIARTAQDVEAAKIIDELFKEFGPDAPIVMAGDFNTFINSENPEIKNITARLKDTFDVAKHRPTEENQATHAYFPPNNGAPQYEQVDAILVAPSLQGSVDVGVVVPYRDETGAERPRPSSFENRETYPSDHTPIVVRILRPR